MGGSLMAFSKATITKIRKHKNNSNDLIGVSVEATILDSDAGITETPTYGIIIDGDTLATIMAIVGASNKKAAFRAEIKSRFISLYDDWVIARNEALPTPNILSNATITTEFGNVDIT